MEEKLQNLPEVKTKNWLRIILLISIILILLIGAFLCGIKFSKKSTFLSLKEQPTGQVITSITPYPTLTANAGELWRKWGANSILSFDYPNGWHIYSLWPDKWESPVSILVDPEPLSDAPRGGPPSVIVIQDYSGNKNPGEILSSNLASARKNISDVSESSFSVGRIVFYKFEGKVNVFEQMVPRLEYHAILKGENTDSLNTHVIKASLEYFTNEEKHAEYVKILDRIVRSLKHRDQI